MNPDIQHRLDKRRTIAPICAALAFIPRLFLFARLPGNDISNQIIDAGREWVTTGQWHPFRSPGSPVYEFYIGLLAVAAGNSATPVFVYANALSMLCVAISLYLLYWIFRAGLSPWRSLLGVALFNFYAHEWVMGASTTDVNFMMLFGIASVYLLLRAHFALALILCFLTVGSRIQALALAAPLVVVLMQRERRAQRTAGLFLWPALAALMACIIFYPSYLAFGFHLFSQPYHQGEFTRSQEIGAFLMRSGNMLGPVGMIIFTGVVLLRARRIVGECSEVGFVAAGVVVLTLCVFFVAPWETFYLLPIVPVAIFVVLRYIENSGLIAVFSFSLLLPNVIQLQLRPWKLPPYAVRDGVISAHLREDWNTRGGR